jgi:hypothetical protein
MGAHMRTRAKVLQSGLFCPTLFKYATEFLKTCDECKRVGNISKRQEIPMHISLPFEPFDVGFDFIGPFPSSSGYNSHIGCN